MVSINSDNAKDYIVATMREHNENINAISTYGTTIKSSGNGRKIYTNVNSGIYTQSRWKLLKVEDADANNDYYVVQTEIWFNKAGKEAES